jgi:hypothetical protein
LDRHCSVHLSGYHQRRSISRPRMRTYSHQQTRYLKMGKENS